MREDDSTDAPLADESDSDDSVQSGKKRAKIAGNMKLLEKVRLHSLLSICCALLNWWLWLWPSQQIARLDRWMPLPTDVMRYNLSYEPWYALCWSLSPPVDRSLTLR
jgi:hypothetical protein